MYIYGKNVVTEYLKNKKKVKKAFLSKKFKEEMIFQLLQNQKIEIKWMDKFELDKLANGMHQGVILSVPDYEYTPIEELETESCLVLLDHLEDPHNFGAIIRTCEAAGVGGIIIPKDRSVEVNPTVVKVSTGAIDHMKIAKVTNLSRTISDLKKQGYWMIGTDMDGTSYDQIDYQGKIVIIIGNEGTGMSRIIRESCDFIAKIPMQGTVNSLNASVATGIVVFEAMRQRK